MSDKTKKTVWLIYGSALSVMLIIAGVLLMTACVNIYRIGDRPFTAENISAEFAKIAVVIQITVAMVVVGAVLAVVLPQKKNKPRAAVDKKALLERLSRAIDPAEITGETAEKLKKQKKLCKNLRATAIILIIAAAIPALLFSFNFNNFSADYNASVITACALILPLTLLSMGIAVAYAFIEAASINYQLTLVKAEIKKSGAKISASSDEKKSISHKTVMIVRISIAAVALIFIVLGIFNGGVSDVLSKAINICTECIGLG